MRPTIADQIWGWLLPRRGDYRNPLRWTHDRDWWWGPFTYSRGDYSPWAVILSSWGGGEDDDRPSNLRISAPWVGTLIIRLPNFLSPHIERVYPQDPAWHAPDGEVYKRLGRDYYENIDVCEYGWMVSNSGAVGGAQHLQLRYGRSTHDSSTDKSWGCFLPWTDWRHVRISFYGLQGELVGSVYDEDHPSTSMVLGGPKGCYDVQRELEARVPKQKFIFRDYDGEQLIATCHIEEREWRWGTKWCKWLSVFRRPIIHRSLDISFSGETGKRKGSWKGGTLGHSIEMRHDDSHLSAFLRYCKENDMTWVGWQPRHDEEKV